MSQPVPMRAGTYEVDGKPVSFNTRTFRLNRDFNLNVASGNTKDLVADGNFEVLYELDVEDGQGVIFGRGANENPLQAQGFTGLRLVNDTAAAQADGDYRIAVRTPQGKRVTTLYEGDLADDDLFDGAAGSGTEKSRKDRSVFSQTNTRSVTEPYVVSIDVSVDSAITVDDAEAETAGKLEGYRGEAMR
jgi:hypothetical protein